MFAGLRRHATTIVVAFITAAVTAGGPVVAEMVYDANNAHKVDGRHAVAAGTSRAERAGELVATDADGYLPSNIIARAPDSAKLGGLSLQDVLVSSSRAIPLYETATALAPVAKFRTTGGNVVLLVSASGYRSLSDGPLTYNVKVDGAVVGELVGYANQTNNNEALPAAFLVVPGLAPGEHTLRLIATGDTEYDLYDTHNVTAIEFGLPELTFECATNSMRAYDGLAMSTTCTATSSAGLSGIVDFGCDGVDPAKYTCQVGPTSASLAAGGSRATLVSLSPQADCPFEEDFRIFARVGGLKRYVPMSAFTCEI